MTTTLCRTIDLALRDARGRFEPVNENTAAFIESQILAAGLLVVDAPTAVAALDGTSNSERFQLDGVKPNGAKSGHDFVSGAPTEEQIERALEALSRFNQWTENPRGAMRAALLAALPALTEGLAGVIGDARDRSRKERDVTKVSLEEWIAAAITEHLERQVKG